MPNRYLNSKITIISHKFALHNTALKCYHNCHYSLLLKVIAMSCSIKKTVLQYKLESTNDDIFLESLNKLADKKGAVVYQCALKLLTSIDIGLESSETHWHNALKHRMELSENLQRDIDLTTSFSDYLQSSTKLLLHPRLIESSLYENVINEKSHDKLTGLFNRPYFDDAYASQISMSRRYQDEFAILFLDIDNFKDVNDTYGHLGGDEALKQIAAIIIQQKRDSDIAARFGGEEFVLLMPRTDNINAFICAERLRKYISAHKINHQNQSFSVTVSGGIASYPFNSQDPRLLLEMADNAVYLAKGAGKNRISHFKEEKRRYLRVKIHQPILIKELDFNDSKTFSGISKDICVGGILFENDSPLPLGALIKVQVPVNKVSPVILIGTVVRVENYGNNKYDIGMTTSFKEMEKIVSTEIGSMLRKQNVA